MEPYKKKKYVRQFLALSGEEQQSILGLMHEFEEALILSKGKAYHNRRPIKRTLGKLLR